MSRFPKKFAAPVSLFVLTGCMYPPMHQQGQYGPQMYGPQGNFAPSGTIVVPPSNAPLYQPGGSTYSSPTTPRKPDDFSKPADADDDRFFKADEVPLPSDAGTGTGEGSGTRPFSSDLDTSN